MVRFTDKAREFWLEQSLDKGEMPKRDSCGHNKAPRRTLLGFPVCIVDDGTTHQVTAVYFRPGHKPE